MFFSGTPPLTDHGEALCKHYIIVFSVLGSRCGPVFPWQEMIFIGLSSSVGGHWEGHFQGRKRIDPEECAGIGSSVGFCLWGCTYIIIIFVFCSHRASAI